MSVVCIKQNQFCVELSSIFESIDQPKAHIPSLKLKAKAPEKMDALFPFWNGLFAGAKTGCYIKRIRVLPGFFSVTHHVTPPKKSINQAKESARLVHQGNLLLQPLDSSFRNREGKKKGYLVAKFKDFFWAQGLFKKHLGWKHVNDDVFIALPWKYTDMTSDIPTYSEV